MIPNLAKYQANLQKLQVIHSKCEPKFTPNESQMTLYSPAVMHAHYNAASLNLKCEESLTIKQNPFEHSIHSTKRGEVSFSMTSNSKSLNKHLSCHNQAQETHKETDLN